jgi:hypothetical protein
LHLFQDSKWLAGESALLREAAMAAKKLGLNHIWMNNLCILQDDLDDKLKHIANMRDIYADTSVTLMYHSTGSSGLTEVPQSRTITKRSFRYSLGPYDANTTMPIHNKALDFIYDSVS